jgi:Flp pilus assembly protein TadG
MKTARAPKRGPYRQFQRRPSGVMGAALTCLGLFVVLVVAHYTVNMGHLYMVRQDLQAAADAAALAGASSLYDTPDAVESAALSVASDNYADGLPVSSQSPGTQVTATAFSGDSIYPGCVKVAVTREIQFFGGAFCGLPDSTSITTTAMAGTAGSVTTVNQDQLFPLAVSVDVIPVDRTLTRSPLTMRHLGDQITLFTNAQRTRNAAFTTFTRSSTDVGYLKDAIHQALKPDPGARGLIPQLSVGDSINLNNSASGTRFIAEGDHAFALNQHPLLTVPLITGNPQTGEKATVVGFATFRVVGVVLSHGGHEIDSLSVSLVKGMVHGTSRPLPSTRNAMVDRTLGELSTGIPKLVSLDYLERKPWLQRPDLQVEESAPKQNDSLNAQRVHSETDSITDTDGMARDAQASNNAEQLASADSPGWRLPDSDVTLQPWMIDAALAIVLAGLLSIAAFHVLTKQDAYAKSYKRESPAGNTSGPYGRRWRKPPPQAYTAPAKPKPKVVR